MHTEAMAFVRQEAGRRRWPRVVEFGSRNVNGSVRSVIRADDYVGIDLYAGPGVDVVGDAGRYRGPRADLVVCCEVLEHAPNVQGLVEAAAANLIRGGFFLMTCATDPREPHSHVDGGPIRLGEHYLNIDPGEFLVLLGRNGFAAHHVRVLDRGDLQVFAERVS